MHFKYTSSCYLLRLQACDFFSTQIFHSFSKNGNNRGEGHRVAREHGLHNVCNCASSLFLLHLLKLRIFFPLQESFQVLKSLSSRDDLGRFSQGGNPPAALPPNSLHHTVHHCLHPTKLVPHCH